MRLIDLPFLRRTVPASPLRAPLPPRPLGRRPEDGWDDKPAPSPVSLTPNPDIGNSSFHYADEGRHPLFSAGDLADDVEQGQLGDCGPTAALSDLGKQRPDLLRQAITQNADGTVTVKLYS